MSEEASPWNRVQFMEQIKKAQKIAQSLHYFLSNSSTIFWIAFQARSAVIAKQLNPGCSVQCPSNFPSFLTFTLYSCVFIRYTSKGSLYRCHKIKVVQFIWCSSSGCSLHRLQRLPALPGFSFAPQPTQAFLLGGAGEKLSPSSPKAPNRRFILSGFISF